MYCGKCGSLIKEGNAFCTNCGTPIDTSDMLIEPVQPVPRKDGKETDINNLQIWCILSLVLAFVPLINWIFFIIARNKVKAYKTAGGAPDQQFRLCVNLTKFALVITIVTTVVAFIGAIVLAIVITVKSVAGSLLRLLIDSIAKLF